MFKALPGMNTVGIPITKDGVLPFVHYIIREKGKVELGSFSCAMCHTRVMPDGAILKGAQGNFPFERAAKYSSLVTHARTPPVRSQPAAIRGAVACIPIRWTSEKT